MRMHSGAIVFSLVIMATPAAADSVAVTSGPNGTTIVNGKPCRVVTGKGGSDVTNSTTMTAGSGSSVVVGSGSSGGGSSSSAGADCVVRRPGR